MSVLFSLEIVFVETSRFFRLPNDCCEVLFLPTSVKLLCKLCYVFLHILVHIICCLL